MYGEETDLCHRARALGARPRMTPEATIVHYVGAASARRSDKAALVLKAKITLARRYLPAWQRPAAVFLLRLWPLGRTPRRRPRRPADRPAGRARGGAALGRGLGGAARLAGRLPRPAPPPRPAA